MQLIGLQIEETRNGFEAHQKGCISQLAKTDTDEDFAAFHLVRAKLVWASDSRTTTSCSVTLLTQVSKDNFKEKNLNT